MLNRAAVREADRIHPSKLPEALSTSLSHAAQTQAQEQEQSRIGDERAQAWYRVESAWKSWKDHSDSFAAALDSDNVPDAEAGSYATAVLEFREAISESPWVDVWKGIPADDPQFQGAVELLRDSSFATIRAFTLCFHTPSLGTRAFKQHIGMFPHRLWIVFEREVSRYDLARAGVRLGNPHLPGSSTNPGVSHSEKPPKWPLTNFTSLVRSLSKQERCVFEALHKANGELPLANVKVLCEWSDPIESSWNSLRLRLNRKLKPFHLSISTRARVAYLDDTGVDSRSKTSAE